MEAVSFDNRCFVGVFWGACFFLQGGNFPSKVEVIVVTKILEGVQIKANLCIQRPQHSCNKGHGDLKCCIVLDGKKRQSERKWKVDSHTERIAILDGAELEVCCLCFLPLRCRIKITTTSSCLNGLCIEDCFSPTKPFPENHQSLFLTKNF